ncbi:MAG: carboxymuconolactone decarboxylase family protein [Candidatus Latescibacterota bacterium]
MTDQVEEFNKYRERMNDKILAHDSQTIRRFFNLDTAAYRDGVLDTRTKEMLGLVASTVLRCDDCIRYHLQRCSEEGVRREEFFEILSIALVVGGSIVIPHFRRAVEFLDELKVT